MIEDAEVRVPTPVPSTPENTVRALHTAVIMSEDIREATAQEYNKPFPWQRNTKNIAHGHAAVAQTFYSWVNPNGTLRNDETNHVAELLTDINVKPAIVAGMLGLARIRAVDTALYVAHTANARKQRTVSNMLEREVYTLYNNFEKNGNLPNTVTQTIDNNLIYFPGEIQQDKVNLLIALKQEDDALLEIGKTFQLLHTVEDTHNPAIITVEAMLFVRRFQISQELDDIYAALLLQSELQNPNRLKAIARRALAATADPHTRGSIQQRLVLAQQAAQSLK